MRDPARDAEMKRRDLGMKRRLQIFRTVNAHPGNGGSRGYPVPGRNAACPANRQFSTGVTYCTASLFHLQMDEQN